MAKNPHTSKGQSSRPGKNRAQQDTDRRSQMRARQEAEARHKKINRIIIGGVIGVAVALIATFSIVIAMQSNSSSSTTGGDLVPANATEDNNGLYVNRTDLEAGAPKVEVFFDYQCSACMQFESVFGPQLSSLSDEGKIDLVFRPMTFMDEASRSDASTRTAVATACAAEQGKLSEYHAAVFSLQRNGFPEDALRTQVPQAVGIEDLTGFQKCYNDRQTLDFIEGTNKMAERDNVTSTPTVRVNGEKLDLEKLDSNDPSSIATVIQDMA